MFEKYGEHCMENGTVCDTIHDWVSLTNGDD